MDVVGDILARDRRSRDTALVTADGRERTYHDLITNAYKAANVLRYLGAREGSVVAVDPTPGLHTTLAFLGAARLGAAVRFDPETGIAAGDRVVLVAVDDEPAARAALDANDVHDYLEERDALIRTGATGTNVNDLRALVLD